MSDWTENITVLDDIFSKEEIRDNWIDCNREDWRHGWYSNEDIKKSKSSPPYWHCALGGDDLTRTDVYIESNWVQKIWDKILLNSYKELKLLRVYLNGHTAGQPGGIHIDGWTPDQFTVIYYANPNMTPYDGGALEIWTPNITDEHKAMALDTPYGGPFGPSGPDILKSVWPRPGRVVLFDARFPHCASALTSTSDKFRVSLVFKATKTA